MKRFIYYFGIALCLAVALGGLYLLPADPCRASETDIDYDNQHSEIIRNSEIPDILNAPSIAGGDAWAGYCYLTVEANVNGDATTSYSGLTLDIWASRSSDSDETGWKMGRIDVGTVGAGQTWSKKVSYSHGYLTRGWYYIHLYLKDINGNRLDDARTQGTMYLGDDDYWWCGCDDCGGCFLSLFSDKVSD